MRSRNDMSHMVQRHMSVHAIVGKLLGHDTARRIVDEDIDPVDLLGNIAGYLGGLLPVSQIAQDSFSALGFLLAHVLFPRHRMRR